MAMKNYKKKEDNRHLGRSPESTRGNQAKKPAARFASAKAKVSEKEFNSSNKLHESNSLKGKDNSVNKKMNSSSLKTLIDSKVSKGLQGFAVRSIVFAAIIMALLPLISGYVVDYLGGGLNYTINYFYMEFIYLGIIAVFLIYSRHKIGLLESYRQDWVQTALFGWMGLVFYTLKVFISSFANKFFLQSNIYTVVLAEFALSMIAVTFIALAVFNIRAFKNFYREFTISIAVSFCFFTFAMFLRASWVFFSTFVGNAVAFLLRITMPNSTVTFTGVTLSVDDFSASIGAPCSGIESMAMFTSIFLLLVLYDMKDMIKSRIAPFFIVGLAGMYFMTIIRIYVLYYVGTFNPEMAMSLFHDNLGWVLFVVYMLFFIYFAYPKMLKK